MYYVMLGVGSGTCSILLSIYFFRQLVCELPNSAIIATLFITLSPPSQAAYAIIRLGTVLNSLAGLVSGYNLEAVLSVSVVLGLVVWGVGLWWIVQDCLLAAVRLRQKWEVHPGVWGAVFPVGSFASAAVLISKALPSGFFRVLGATLVAMTALLWASIVLWTVAFLLKQSRQLLR